MSAKDTKTIKSPLAPEHGDAAGAQMAEPATAEMQFVEDLRLFLKTYPKTTVRTL